MAKLLNVTATQKRTWEDVFEEFLMFKKASGIAPLTIKDYKHRVGVFFNKFPDSWGDYRQLRSAITKHFASLADNAPATYNLAVAYLRCFFGWCVTEGILPANPTDGFKKKKDPGKARDVDTEHLQKLLELPSRKTYTGVRDYALILLHIDTGIRPGEALQLLPEHINLRSMEVNIPPGAAKTRVARTVCISQSTAKAIRRLLECRPAAWKDNVPVFSSQDGTRLNVISWGRRLRLYGDKLGIHLTPYMLRHSSAIMYLRNGGHVLSLQRTLGHANLAMTKRYVNLTQNDLREQHDIASPVNSLVPQRHRIRKI